jgi:hypothetical protein
MRARMAIDPRQHAVDARVCANSHGSIDPRQHAASTYAQTVTGRSKHRHRAVDGRVRLCIRGATVDPL